MNVTSISTSLRNLRIASVISAFSHTVGAFVMAFVLGPGLLTNPDYNSRIEYIRTHTQLWQSGWSVWIFTAFTFLAFTVCLRKHHLALGTSDLNRKLLLGAVIYAVIGVSFDLHAELAQIFEATKIFFPEDEFKEHIALQAAFMLESGTIANLMYCLATISSVIAIRNDYPKGLVSIGYSLFFVSLIASGFAFIASLCMDHRINPMKDILVATNAILFPLLVLWQLGIAYKSKGENNA